MNEFAQYLIDSHYVDTLFILLCILISINIVDSLCSLYARFMGRK